jgi:hypothetical protein
VSQLSFLLAMPIHRAMTLCCRSVVSVIPSFITDDISAEQRMQCAASKHC